jgi:hypothetical protein
VATKKKKKIKRKKGSYAKNDKLPALNTRRQVYARQEAMDGDYYHKLSQEDKIWLNAFLSETIVTNFYHGGPELYKKVEDKRRFYRENNSRNKDAINWAKSKSMLSNVEDIHSTLDREALQSPTDVEDSWIEAVVMKDSGSFTEALKLSEEDIKFMQGALRKPKEALEVMVSKPLKKLSNSVNKSKNSTKKGNSRSKRSK